MIEIGQLRDCEDFVVTDKVGLYLVLARLRLTWASTATDTWECHCVRNGLVYEWPAWIIECDALVA